MSDIGDCRSGVGEQREFGTDAGSGTQPALDRELAVQRLDAIANVGQPAGTGTIRLEPATLVLNNQAESAAWMR